jgi:DNA repair ATPase RecN
MSAIDIKPLGWKDRKKMESERLRIKSKLDVVVKPIKEAEVRDRVLELALHRDSLFKEVTTITSDIKAYDSEVNRLGDIITRWEAKLQTWEQIERKITIELQSARAMLASKTSELAAINAQYAETTELLGE